MNRTLAISPEARAEILMIVAERKKLKDGSHRRFRELLDATCKILVMQPHVYREVEPRVYKMNMLRLSFYVFYTFDDNSVTILAVRHTSRDPVSFEDRLPEPDGE